MAYQPPPPYVQTSPLTTQIPITAYKKTLSPTNVRSKLFAQIVMTLLALVDCAAVVYVLFTSKRSFYDRMIYTLIIFLLPFAGAAFAAYKHYYWLKEH